MSLGKENHVGQNEEQLKIVLETKEVCLQKLNDENDTLIRENKRLKKEKATLEKEKAKLENEKDDALSRLSKLAGQKLTDGNPTITDLGNPNRPEKIGERWASLYTDEWTDVYEDLTEQNKRKSNNNELPEKQLIKIVDWCYKRCLEIAKEQNNKIHETLWELVRFIHFLGAKPKELENIKQIQGNIHTEDTMMTTAMKDFEKNAKFQLQCSTTLIDAVRKQCCEDYISSYPESLTSAKHFIMKCSELCWHVLSSNPPMTIDYENFEQQPIDPNKFNKYNRSGTTVEYVVWPALLLHKDGPVLAKGTVQTNYEDKTVPRKKSAEDIFAPPKTCKPSSSPTVKDDITSNEISDPVQCTKNALKGDSHASDSELKQTNPKKQDQPNNLSQKADYKSINPLCQSKEKESDGDSRQQVSANTDQSGLINDMDKSLPKSKGCINQSGLKKIMKPGSGLQTGDAENINESCRYLEENGESNSNTTNDQLIGGISDVRAKGSEEVKSETSNSNIGDKGIGDNMEETNQNDVRNEFKTSSNIVTQHQCKPMNQYENISIKECHTTQDMKCDELNISVHKGVQSQNDGRDIDYSKPQNEPEALSLDGSKNSTTYSSETKTHDKCETPNNNQIVKANSGITDLPTDSKVGNTIKFYSKLGNQLNENAKRSGTIQRKLEKVCQTSKLPKEKDLNKPKKESKTSRKNSSN
ncbi:uncharacterized protein LOC127715633 isoform X4 [Mytilus californianus]|uniref:uncharacterized protein LOC127715633 isoform X4 n=1 Tax=Mytilus californianus TaxID=6549 RepID=UPI002247B3B8|nr:uncharacterized protein LOC127715633 isoform X4 [Mytilus californianus]